jgi:hypothetical protein
MENFRRLALFSPDLVDTDAKRIVKKEEDRLAEVQGKILQTGSGHSESDIGDFQSLNLYDRDK